ncbi:MAG: hypothetical protein R3B96_09390 [Pirellulaceae bacterium]
MVKRPKYTEETAISFYDQVSGLISAGVFFLAFIVAVLFLLWLSVMASRARINTAVEVVGPELGEDEKPEGEADDIEEPGSEFPEVETPQLADALEALSSAVSNIAASDREVDGSAEAMGAGRGLGSRDGGGVGNGGRGPWERWEIRYTTASRDAYAQQLDGLGIELERSSGKDQPSSTSPICPAAWRLVAVPRARRSEFTSTTIEACFVTGIFSSRRRRVNLRDKLLVQFYPPTIQQTLLELERRKLGGRTVEEVYRTVFGVRPPGAASSFT